MLILMFYYYISSTVYVSRNKSVLPVRLLSRVSGCWGSWTSRMFPVPETPSCTELGGHWLLACCTSWPPVSFI